MRTQKLKEKLGIGKYKYGIALTPQSDRAENGGAPSDINSTIRRFVSTDMELSLSKFGSNSDRSLSSECSMSEPANQETPKLKEEELGAIETITSSPRLFNTLNTKFGSDSLEQFSFELFEDLEYLLKPIEQETPNITKHCLNSNLQRGVISEPTSISFENDIIDFMNSSNLFGGNERLISSDASKIQESVTVTYEEENMMLKHFFKKLLPLLDAHPNSPWPDLALKYCDFDVARSCFIALACIHMYESRKGGEEYYKKGMAHINITMEHLILNISNSGEKPNSENSSSRTIAENRKKQVSSFAILVLINVHILFAVLEKGKSSFVRFFFRVFASICRDSEFYNRLMENEKKRSLVVVLSWYDTISAIVSPDCRLPYCTPTWYGSSNELISTSKMMGCPGEIFCAMSKLCFMRRDVHYNIKKDREEVLEEYLSIKIDLLLYRDYVSLDDDGVEAYYLRLKCAQCWTLAVQVTLNRVVKPLGYEKLIRKDVLEFINVYGSMESISPMVTQMVWPVYAIGCECKFLEEQESMLSIMETLYQNAQMGTLFSLKRIVQQVWQQGITQEEYLMTWLDVDVNYLPL